MKISTIRIFCRVIAACVLLFEGVTCFAQTQLPLLAQWQKAAQQPGYKNDTASVNLLNSLSLGYRYNQADSSLYFAKQALQLAQFQKNKPGQIASLNNIGMAYYVLGEYFQSLDAASKLMQLSNTIDYQPGVANAYQVMGLIFLGQNKFEDAINQFAKALDGFTKVNDQAKIARMYFDIGLCYDELGLPKKAFTYLDKALNTGELIKDEHIISMTYNRMGETFFHLKNYPQAIVYYQKVLNAHYQDNWERDFAFSGLAQTYYGMGLYQLAITNANKGLNLASQANSRYDIVRALKILSESYAALEDYGNAYRNEALYKINNDSLLNDTKEKEINYLHLKQQQVDNIRLEKENELNKQKLNSTRLIIIIISLAAIFVIIILLIISRSNMHKTALNKALKQQSHEISRQKEALDDLNHTKDMLFSVISHDLRSPFAAIMQTIDLVRSGDVDDAEQKVLIDDFYRQVTIVNNMVNNMLVWAGGQQKGAGVEKTSLNLTGVVDEILSVSAFMAKNKQINIEHIHNGDQMVSADPNHVKIIIQNLVGNAIKFTPERGIIVIHYTCDDKYRAIHVKDSGIGISEPKIEKLFKVVGKEISGDGTNKETGAGIGLALVKQFVDINKGSIEIKSEVGKGTEFIVYLLKADV
ncbi:tetratricopeptide repeat-containing sensor histidine kinase [Mucilaginibacter ginsenosidivorax]|uniref:histidine kinase n=1 Tax=Mucilaginibacter ginsenosidivorax TaxID=862126 RepID=A0A5B8VZT4_9SPHI|nr:tetratricopeptide repeat protein [Mucilaginibacter ginsenosidivorax]QEC77200.1 tetratricopeptide repeat protein [Mucilaginibacter ginsenosidivorax]